MGDFILLSCAIISRVTCFVLFWCSEKEILHEEISSLELVNDRLKGRLGELEEEVHKMRDALRKTSDDSGPTTNVEVRTFKLGFLFNVILS